MFYYKKKKLPNIYDVNFSRMFLFAGDTDAANGGGSFGSATWRGNIKLDPITKNLLAGGQQTTSEETDDLPPPEETAALYGGPIPTSEEADTVTSPTPEEAENVTPPTPEETGDLPTPEETAALYGGPIPTSEEADTVTPPTQPPAANAKTSSSGQGKTGKSGRLEKPGSEIARELDEKYADGLRVLKDNLDINKKNMELIPTENQRAIMEEVSRIKKYENTAMNRAADQIDTIKDEGLKTWWRGLDDAQRAGYIAAAGAAGMSLTAFLMSKRKLKDAAIWGGVGTGAMLAAGYAGNAWNAKPGTYNIA